jgi:hypothetical protein
VRRAVFGGAYDRIIFDPISHKLYYDADGTGPQSGVEFAGLYGANLRLTYADFFVIYICVDSLSRLLAGQS